MKLAYASTFNSQDVANWSGTPFYMAQAFTQNQVAIDFIGGLKHRTPPFFKVKQIWKKLLSGQRESPRFNIYAAKAFSEQTLQQLGKRDVNAILAPQINPICYLDTNKPIVLWTDALYSSLIGFYPGFSAHSASSIEQGNQITQACLSRTSLAIFSSEWAARSAIEIYGADKNKVQVVPFGANLANTPTLEEIKAIIKKRSQKKLKLLFLGKHWHRKGGDIVFNVAKTLHQLGQPVEVNFVGCYPPAAVSIPNYINCHGFISKRTSEGVLKIQQLLQESHFLIVPSRAEAYGIVFCEANAYGLPCITSTVGGISTIIKDNINGMTFALDAPSELYAHYLITLMQDYHRYQEMAFSAHHEFITRLNWTVATKKVKELIQNIV